MRFDALAAGQPPRAANALQHRLERRALRRAAMLLPWGLDPARRVPGRCCARAAGGRAPVAIGQRRTTGPREPIAVTYAGNPDKKGLDLITERGAWPHRRAGAWS